MCLPDDIVFYEMDRYRLFVGFSLGICEEICLERWTGYDSEFKEGDARDARVDYTSRRRLLGAWFPL